MTLRLHFRNRTALLYGYLFPIIFLGAFWALYRYEKIPLLLHMGELLTISVLSSACFGLSTTLVSERERGVWRRYRVAPVDTRTLVLSLVGARFLIILTAGLLQIGLAMAMGMTAPAHPFVLALVFTFVAFAFIALGLVIAALADNIPAVQALGQCLFLPMLILGGVAVPLGSLPAWAQHLSAFLPGRYAVESLQATVTGDGLVSAHFDLLALALIGAAACFSGAKLFRWSPGQHFKSVEGKHWLIPALAIWFVVGALAESRGRIAVKPAPTVDAHAATGVALAPPTSPPQPWELLTDTDLDSISYAVPPDDGLVTPIARADETPDEATDLTLANLEGDLPHWAPGYVKDPVQRARNLLSVAAVLDLLQNPVERFVPSLVQGRLETDFSREKLIRLLGWIALHPNEGAVVTDLSDLHLEGVASDAAVRERVQLYATKFVARLTGRKTIRK